MCKVKRREGEGGGGRAEGRRREGRGGEGNGETEVVMLILCFREASQVFGGLAYTRGGEGEKVERIYRDLRSIAIGGGSEEIMLDLAVRMAMLQAKL